MYNYTSTATSLTGYKHNDEAISKIIERYEDISNHPMYSKTQTK
jgi:NUMOD3 motif